MTIDWWTLGLQTINFLVVVWLLSRFLYRPIRRVIEEREAADKRAAAAAQDKADKAEALRKDYEARLAEMADTLREKEAALHAEMAQEQQKTTDAAKAKAAKLVADARAQAETERRQALDALRSRIADLAHDLAAQALHDTGDPASAAMLARVDAYFDALPDNDMADLRADAAAGSEGVTVVTATALPKAAREKWRKALQARLGDRPVTFETDPEILGGIDLHLPHARVGFSVADRLNQASAAMKAGDEGSAE